MPRTPKKPLELHGSDQKPYLFTPKKMTDIKASTSTGGSGGKASPWTGEELVVLFRFAMDRNGREWSEAVEGRNASQARQTSA
jgi:hypothetical protein